MIQANVTKVLYSYDLKNHREEVDCVILELPNGMELRAPAGPEHVNYFNEYLAKEKYHEAMEEAEQDPNNVGYAVVPGGETSTQDAEPTYEELPAPSVPAVASMSAAVAADQPHEEDPIVPWGLMPEKAIPEHVKLAMQSLNLPAELPLSQAMAIMERILDEFSAEDWAKLGVGQTVEPAQPQRPPVPPSARVGEVTWNDGSPVIPSARVPSRTVQSDEKGNPIVGHGDVDPGELVGGGDDEEGDGVGQF